MVIIIAPPKRVSILGCSFIINQTQIGPIIVSSKKNRLTSAAGINLGAIVTRTKGIATQRIHITGTIIRSLSISAKLSIKNKAKVATFALFFIESFALIDKDLIIVPVMCILCVAIPFVLVTIAPRFIPAAEVNLFFLLETIIGPIWVWLIIKEQPSIETLLGGAIIITTIAIHSFLKLKNS